MTKTELFLVLIIAVYFVVRLALSLHKQEVKIRYRDDEVSPIKNISVGDWIDLASNTEVKYKKGDMVVIDLGVAMELPSWL